MTKASSREDLIISDTGGRASSNTTKNGMLENICLMEQTSKHYSTIVLKIQVNTHCLSCSLQFFIQLFIE